MEGGVRLLARLPASHVRSRAPAQESVDHLIWNKGGGCTHIASNGDWGAGGVKFTVAGRGDEEKRVTHGEGGGGGVIECPEEGGHVEEWMPHAQRAGDGRVGGRQQRGGKQEHAKTVPVLRRRWKMALGEK